MFCSLAIRTQTFTCEESIPRAPSPRGLAPLINSTWPPLRWLLESLRAFLIPPLNPILPTINPPLNPTALSRTPRWFDRLTGKGGKKKAGRSCDTSHKTRLAHEEVEANRSTSSLFEEVGVEVGWRRGGMERTDPSLLYSYLHSAKAAAAA